MTWLGRGASLLTPKSANDGTADEVERTTDEPYSKPLYNQS